MNIERITEQNEAYRKIVQTTREMQLVVMSLKSVERVPLETHIHASQFIRVESGSGVVLINGKRHHLSDGRSVIIPAGAQHEIRAGRLGMKLYTIYSPPVH